MKSNTFGLYYWKVLLLIPLLILLFLIYLGFDGLYGQDSYEYFRYTNRLRDFLSGGNFPGDLVWPKGYLFLTAFFSMLMPVALAGQVISLSSFFLSFYFLKRLIKLWYPQSDYATLYLFFAFLLSPYILRLSTVMMADTLAILCLSATAFYTIAYHKHGKLSLLFFAVLWASFGAFSRYAFLVVVAPLMLFLFWSCWRNKQWLAFVSILIPLFFLVLHQYFEGNGSDFLNHYFIEKWSFSHYFQNQFVAATDIQSPTVSYTLPNIFFVFFGFMHPGFSILIPLGVLIAIRYKLKPNSPIALYGSIALYSLFLAGISFQSSRYLCLSYPLILIALYPFVQALFNQLIRWRIPIFIAAVILQLFLIYQALQPSYQLNKMEQYLAKEVKGYEGNTLYTFEVDVALKQRGLDFTYQNLWTQEFESFKIGALVLFNEKRYAHRYEGKNVMNNWDALQSNYSLNLLKELEDGWKIYRINE